MTENESGFWTGATTGAMTGASSGAAIGMLGGPIGVGAGAVVGGLIGFAAGGILGNDSADKTRRAKIDAEKKAEAARRGALVKQMGAAQQAESLALQTSNPSAPKAASKPSAPPSAMGNNLSTSGTF
jgi:phage tail tape-measure protein